MDSNDKTYCVYIHTLYVDGQEPRVYVGITSQKPEARWERDGKGYCRRKKGKYCQPLMANAIHKYGWDAFKHQIWAEGLTKEEAEKVEKLLIAFWDTRNPKHGLNIAEGGSAPKPSKETKEKISKALKEKYKDGNHYNCGKHWDEEQRDKIIKAISKRVLCIETGIIYLSAREVEKTIHINHTSIAGCCRGERKTAGGYHWQYYEELKEDM